MRKISNSGKFKEPMAKKVSRKINSFANLNNKIDNLSINQTIFKET